MDKDREIALIKGCQAGDRKALGELVNQLQKPVYNAAFRMLGNAEDAADVTQTTMLKLFENINRYDPDRNLSGWACRIAVNESLDRLRRESRSVTLDHEPQASDDTPQDATNQQQLGEHVQTTLMELNEDHRAVVVLRYFSECSYADIGQALDLPEKTVKSRLFSARRQLRDKLQAHGVFSS